MVIVRRYGYSGCACIVYILNLLPVVPLLDALIMEASSVHVLPRDYRKALS